MQINPLRFSKSIGAVLAAASFVVALGSGEAWAIKLLGKTNTGAIVFSDADSHEVLARNITLNKKGQVVIIYSAECSVAGTDTTSWVNIDILIDGVALEPTNGDNAFCTSTGTNNLDGWVSASTQGRTVLDPGVHSISVVGNLVVFDDGDRWRIDDQSLSIIIQKN